MRLIDRSEGCTCDVKRNMAAALNGQPMPLCPQHDADQIVQRRRDERDAELGSMFANSLWAFEQAKAALNKPPVCTCRGLAEGLAASLAGNAPKPCEVHTNAAPTPDETVSLNGRPLPHKLAQLLGVNDPPPQDAA